MSVFWVSMVEQLYALQIIAEHCLQSAVRDEFESVLSLNPVYQALGGIS